MKTTKNKNGSINVSITKEVKTATHFQFRAISTMPIT